MDEQERIELVGEAQEMCYRLYRQLVEELSDRGRERLMLYANLKMYIRMLTRQPINPHPPLTSALAWEQLHELVVTGNGEIVATGG